MKLTPRSIILLAVHDFGGKVVGKTLLQKRLYFMAELLRPGAGELGLAYMPHYYGPYSPVVASELGTLVVQGLLQEQATPLGVANSLGFEMRRHIYKLTDDGKTGAKWLEDNYPEDTRQIKDTAEKILQAEGNTEDYMSLSVAAKAHWILKRTKQPLTEQLIADEAHRFGWLVTGDQIRRGCDFLRRLGLFDPQSVQSAS
jgi:uncharacterized protein YwgA